MRSSVKWGFGALMLILIVFLPGVAAAQSSFTGQVRDESGAALPGVNVEAASPVLIEKLRSVVTDSQGRYTIVDLIPGVYKLTFSLTGFSTVVRDEISLPATFTATVNADLKIGSLEETITVSGQTPIVDVQQASKTVVLTRDLTDALPTTRNLLTVGQMIPGIRVAVPDVGGTQMLEQAGMRDHGMNQRNTTIYFDGQQTNSSGSDGQSVPYSNEEMNAEVSVRTSALPAEIGAGGVNVNSIPKDGGNIFSGSVFLGGSDGTWQSNNITPALRQRGVVTPDGIAHIQIFTAAIGGPILKNRIWFFLAARHGSTDVSAANVPPYITLTAAELSNRPLAAGYSFYPGQSVRVIQNQFIRDATPRITAQLTPKNKLALMMERSWKFKGHEFTSGVDPEFAGTYRNPQRGQYTWGTVKFTSTISSRLLLEAGYAFSTFDRNIDNEPWVDLPEFVANGQFNPDWIANARRTDTALNHNPLCILATGCTAWESASDTRGINSREPVSASLSYVTGTHNIKTGFQWSFGPDQQVTSIQGDLTENYVNGVPQSVTVNNGNVRVPAWVKADVGIYLQDTWTIKRLTLNPGVRVEYFNARMNAVIEPASRFVAQTYHAEQDCLPCWGPNFRPRFSGGYDLFGNGKTALKASASEYSAPYTGSFARAYADAAAVTESRNWFDCDLNAAGTACSGVNLPTNGDGIAQANEIGPSSSQNFGVASTHTHDPNLQRFYNWEYTASVQHQLKRNVSVSVNYYRRTYRQLVGSQRTAISPSGYTAFTSPIPSFSNDSTLNGVLDPSQNITLYNLNPAFRSVYSVINDHNTSDQSNYNGVETSFSARIPGGIQAYGGWTIERNISIYCTRDDDPNGSIGTDLYSGAPVEFGGRYCDQSKFSVPFKSDFKLAGVVPVPFGITFGFNLQAYPGTQRAISWTPAAGLFPGGRTESETVLLSEPGTLYEPRYNQLDINFKKTFRSGHKTFSGEVDVFNVMNTASILSTNDSIGGSLGQVTSVLYGRLPRLTFQMKW